MRKELEPDLDVAKNVFNETLQLLEEYNSVYNFEKELKEYKKLIKKLTELTGKNIEKYNLYEWWGEECEENIATIAFVISFPMAFKNINITKDELEEIVVIIKNQINIPFEECQKSIEDNNSFENIYKYKSSIYYMELLKKNFKKYSEKLFYKHKDNNGKYIEYTTKEIVGKIWDKK
jgi:hypothetical protein